MCWQRGVGRDRGFHCTTLNLTLDLENGSKKPVNGHIFHFQFRLTLFLQVQYITTMSVMDSYCIILNIKLCIISPTFTFRLPLLSSITPNEY